MRATSASKRNERTEVLFNYFSSRDNDDDDDDATVSPQKECLAYTGEKTERQRKAFFIPCSKKWSRSDIFLLTECNGLTV